MKQNLQQTCAKAYLVANRKMMNYLGPSQGLITLSIFLEQTRPKKLKCIKVGMVMDSRFLKKAVTLAKTENLED